MIKRYKELKD